MHFHVQGPAGTYFISSAPAAGGRITNDHWFRFASITKFFTSAAVLNMAEAGWLGIDDTITANIPGTSTPYVPTDAAWDIPYKDQITIRQLMAHTAGVYDCDNDVVPALGTNFTEHQLAMDPSHTFTPEDFTGTNAANALSYFAPGTGFHYSNVGYSMLATIIARVYSTHSTGPKTYADYMHEVMVPSVPTTVGRLPFPDAATDDQVPQPGRNGMIYRGGTDTTTITRYNPTILVAQGNGQGTMKAVHDWVRATLKGNGALTAQTIQLMNTPLVPDLSNGGYTYGYQDFGPIGRGHSGARVGNLSIVSYDPVRDVSMIGYLPIWDLSDGMTSFAENCFDPLGITMVLLAEVAAE
jgi:D-alanyl-D-alanine carboxypeptidase